MLCLEMAVALRLRLRVRFVSAQADHLFSFAGLILIKFCAP